MTLAVEAHGLTRSFGAHTAVAGIDLAVRPGQVFGYLGLNGAGKSTTIKMLCGLLPPTAGTARVLGLDVADPALRRIIGLVGDEAGDSRPTWTAREYLGYFAALHGADAAVEPLLDTVGLEPQWRSRPLGTFSTGMKRRVEVARALLGRPRLLFLDEPTRGLDLPAKRQMWDLLRRLVGTGQVTVFLSSHDVLEIRALCHELAVIARGRLTYAGPAARLGATPEAFEQSLLRLLEGRTLLPASPSRAGPR